jgi:hypothetical protein
MEKVKTQGSIQVPGQLQESNQNACGGCGSTEQPLIWVNSMGIFCPACLVKQYSPTSTQVYKLLEEGIQDPSALFDHLQRTQPQFSIGCEPNNRSCSDREHAWKNQTNLRGRMPNGVPFQQSGYRPMVGVILKNKDLCFACLAQKDKTEAKKLHSTLGEYIDKFDKERKKRTADRVAEDKQRQIQRENNDKKIWEIRQSEVNK